MDKNSLILTIVGIYTALASTGILVYLRRGFNEEYRSLIEKIKTDIWTIEENNEQHPIFISARINTKKNLKNYLESYLATAESNRYLASRKIKMEFREIYSRLEGLLN